MMVFTGITMKILMHREVARIHIEVTDDSGSPLTPQSLSMGLPRTRFWSLERPAIPPTKTTPQGGTILP